MRLDSLHAALTWLRSTGPRWFVGVLRVRRYFPLSCFASREHTRPTACSRQHRLVWEGGCLLPEGKKAFLNLRTLFLLVEKTNSHRASSTLYVCRSVVCLRFVAVSLLVTAVRSRFPQTRHLCERTIIGSCVYRVLLDSV